MKINLYFGEKGLTKKYIYLDHYTPLEQVKAIEELKTIRKSINILTFSPYIIEAVDAVFNEDCVSYFNNGVKSNLLDILSEISEAFYRIQELKDIDGT